MQLKRAVSVMNGLSIKQLNMVNRIDKRVREFDESPKETEALLMTLHQNFGDFKALISTLSREQIDELSVSYVGFARFSNMLELVRVGLTKPADSSIREFE